MTSPTLFLFDRRSSSETHTYTVSQAEAVQQYSQYPESTVYGAIFRLLTYITEFKFMLTHKKLQADFWTNQAGFCGMTENNNAILDSTNREGN